ncbi:uncharacterized protein RB166_021403 [Leptodactylus fuscus]|uniref:uncharacterized protein LOC142188552 n=1 Tax=Leptodactylus fuscus TaxID=238119 RepID=UPI003F4EC8D6
MVTLVILLMVLAGLSTAEDPIEVKAHLGSDLLLPLVGACGNRSYQFDVYCGSQRIGVYDGELQEMKGYQDRLTYDPKTCTLTLKGLNGQDGTTFTVTLYIDRDGRSAQSDIKYKVVLQVPSTSSPNTPIMDPTPVHTTYNTSQVLPDAVLGFVSFCLSLDSLINAAILGLLYYLIWCRDVSLMGYPTELKQRSMNMSCHINIIGTVVSQISSIILITISSGISLSWLLILFPAVPVAGYLCPYVLPSCPATSRCCRDELAPRLWNAVILIIQIFFPLSVGLLHFTRGYNSHCKDYSSVAKEVSEKFPDDPGEKEDPV